MILPQMILPSLFCGLALVAFSGLAADLTPNKAKPAQALPWSQSFEQQLPGEAPAGWGYRWGQAGDDLVSISNLEAAEGRRALLLDRTTGTQATMGGFGICFPDVRDGTAVITFHLLYTGAGHNAHFSLLIRDRKSPHATVAAIQAGDQALMFSGTGYRGKTRLGSIRDGRWYRVRLWLPTGGAPAGTVNARAELAEMTAPGVYTPADSPIDIATATPPAAYGILELVTAPGKRDFRLYLDDLSVAQE
jgi:hypothetical protein